MDFSSPTQQTPRSVLREINRLSTLDLMGSSSHGANFLTMSSADEQVIRLRGRRILVSSPEKTTPTRGSNLRLASPASPRKSPRKSPVKSPCKSPYRTIRTSPRKRFLLDPESPSSPSKMARINSYQPLPWCPPERSQLKPSLKALSRSQLLKLVEHLIDHVPEVEKEIRKELPRPDLTDQEERLERLKRNIYTSFPRNRWGSRRDGFCFHRVSTHVEVFKKECIGMSRELLGTEQWTILIEYVFLAWKFVEELPDWENPGHNKDKQICFRTLASHCLKALKHCNLKKNQYEQIVDRLLILKGDGKELEPCIGFVQGIIETCK